MLLFLRIQSYLISNNEGEPKDVLPIPHRVKKPKLTDAERKDLQERISKDVGISISVNLLLQTLL